MQARRPRFALVLTAIVGAAALVIALTTRSSPTHTPPSVGIGPGRACVRSQAEARVTARSSIVITATSETPVSVTEEAGGANGTIVVTRSETTVARVSATQPVAVARTELASGRACASGSSSTAARSLALRIAYTRALARAHASAEATAARALRTLERRLYPSVLAKARAAADARAKQLALGARNRLAAQAEAEAVKRAGG